ncbi:hypothetical protein DFH06DRAFT_1351515 [Mycena polygramma]|nr:hypothetical protein DFH06DRAFT_1351515 [Mycena polygramma]
MRNLAFNFLGPLFTWDVEKVDKQDDRAAARLFSAATLEFRPENHPDQTGLSVYLFVFGEPIDAWQNRNIFHRDRVKMVLRACFFPMAWRSNIVAHPGTQFISRESFDIFLTICDGLLRVPHHRLSDFPPTYRLLPDPWLHPTEAYFTYADVLNFEQLRALMLGAFGNPSADEQATQTSAGYHHTYSKDDDLDTPVLPEYPTDKEISEQAYNEAAQLLKLLKRCSSFWLSTSRRR